MVLRLARATVAVPLNRKAGSVADMAWSIATAEDIGSRGEQQDRVTVLRSRRGGETLVVMADGMGGHADGAAAAQKVVEVAEKVFGKGEIEQPRVFLEQVCEEAHDAIRAFSNGERRPPGSTCALLYLIDKEAYWVHVGDSRLYHFSEDGLRSRTQDHTIAELMARDTLGDGEGRASNLLYMCLGGDNHVVPVFGATAVEEGDWFMLCTDGFWSQVRSHEVARLMRVAGSLEIGAKQLVAVARRRGSESCDNIALALVQRDERRSVAGRLGRLLFR